MIIWLNGPFGVGKTAVAYELNRRLSNSMRYNPANIGQLLRKQLPKELQQDNFQDYPEWRQWNYQLLTQISQQTEKTIIIPMLVTNLNYFDEIIGHLRADGVDLHHYTLTATTEVIQHRLKMHGDLHNSLALTRLEKNTADLTDQRFAKFIDTTNLSITQTADLIAKDCSLRIQPAFKNKYAQSAIQFGDTIKSFLD